MALLRCMLGVRSSLARGINNRRVVANKPVKEGREGHCHRQSQLHLGSRAMYFGAATKVEVENTLGHGGRLAMSGHIHLGAAINAIFFFQTIVD